MKYGQVPTVKVYYSISEVSERTGIPSHMLRFWENVFPMLRPKKNRGGNRAYRQRDIELVLRIKQLVLEEKFTYEGALQKIRPGELQPIAAPAVPLPRKVPDPNVLRSLRAELLQTLAMLKETPQPR